MTNAPHSSDPDAPENGQSATDKLAAQIARARQTRTDQRSKRVAGQDELSGAGRAFRYASEFIAAIVAGAALGFGIDTLAGTSPWALIVLLLVGFAAGVLNIIRAAAEQNEAAQNSEEAGTLPAAREEDDETRG